MRYIYLTHKTFNEERETRLFNINILDKRITCNRKDLQQLVGRSSVSVLPPGMREARLFNPKYATFIYFKTEEQKTFMLWEAE